MPDHDPIVIAGAGPAGLSAAWALASEGVPVAVFEIHPRVMPDWRASTFHPPTLELLDGVGVATDMLAEGLAVDRFQYRDRRRGLVAEFDLNLLASDTPFPFRLQLNQQRLAQILAERLAAHPAATLCFDSEVVDAHQHADGVTVTTRTPDGQQRHRGWLLLGADGAGSTVRQIIGASFEGITYEERYLIVSVAEELDQAIPGLGYVNYIADPVEALFILRTPESWRVLWPVPPGMDHEQALGDAYIQDRLHAVAPQGQRYRVIDRQLYTVHQRVASTFRDGRILLLGDAAHINSPFGGMGLNSGIHDGFDLSRRVLRVRQGGETSLEDELETYAHLRRTVALDYVRTITHRNTRRLQERSEAAREREHAELAAIAADPERAREWLLQSSMIASVRAHGIGESPRLRQPARDESHDTEDRR